MEKFISLQEFTQKVAIDNKIDLRTMDKLKLPNSSKSIKSFVKGRAKLVLIWDGSKEHPFLIDNTIRNSLLETGLELRAYRLKTLYEVLKEAKLKLREEKTQICEGGGWYSSGLKVFYNNFYTEF